MGKEVVSVVITWHNHIASLNGECVSSVQGSKSIAGHSTVHNGTWEGHVVSEGSLQQVEEGRRMYGDVAVRPVYIRGVSGSFLSHPNWLD